MDRNAVQNWVEAQGGVVAVASKLRLTTPTVRNWLHRRGWPKVSVILKLIKISKGELTFENIIASTKRRG